MSACADECEGFARVADNKTIIVYLQRDIACMNVADAELHALQRLFSFRGVDNKK